MGFEQANTDLEREVTYIPTAPVRSPVYSIPDGALTFEFRIKRYTLATPTIWPDADSHISVTVFLSLDAGVTWVFLTGYTTMGGPVRDERGREETENRHLITLHPASDFATALNRKMRVSFSSLHGAQPELIFTAEAR